MRRSGPPKRRTRLVSGTGLVRRTKLAGSNRPMRKRAPAKPGMSSLERKAKALVRVRAADVCEACGFLPAVDWHHRLRDGQGGKWSADNGMHLCRRCHDWIGDNPTAACALGWWVKPWEDPTRVPVLYRCQTWVVLGDDGAITPVGSADADWTGLTGAGCPATKRRTDGVVIHCERGLFHDPDHECGLESWPESECVPGPAIPVRPGHIGGLGHA